MYMRPSASIVLSIGFLFLLGCSPAEPPPQEIATAEMITPAESGDFMIDGGPPIRDEDGQEVSFQDFIVRLESGGWRSEARPDDDGKVVEIVMFRDEDVPPAGERFEGDIVSHTGGPWFGKTLPELNLTTIDGRHVTSADLKGKPIVLNFWFRACKPCLLEIPALNKIVETFANEDTVFLALTFDSEADVRTVLKEHPFSYEIIADNLEIQEVFAINTFPTHLVFDRSHQCTTAIAGYHPGIGVQLENEIRKALK